MRNLFIALGLILVGCGSSKEYSSITQLLSGNLSQSARGGTSLLAEKTCPTGKICLTPTNLEGRIYSGGLMVGGNGGTSGYRVSTVGATSEVRQRPDLGKNGTLIFDLKNTTEFTGGYFCCGGSSYPSDAEAIVRRLEFDFDTVDATVTVPSTAGTAIQGKTYTIRLIYVNDTTVSDIVSGESTTVYMADKLVKGPGETTFKWCDGSGCTATTRPSSGLLSDSSIVARSGEGNNNYSSVWIALDNEITFTKAEAEQGSWKFRVNFNVSNAAIFEDTDWANIQTVRQLVDKFSLPSDMRNNYQTAVTVALTKEKV